jgi:hypothetical protein
MLKKLIGFGLVFGMAAGASALTGGCSSTTQVVDDAGGGGGKEGGTQVGEGGVQPDQDADTATTCPSAKMPTPASYDDPVTGFGWTGPKQTLNACATGDIAALKANFGNMNLMTYGDLKMGLSAGCTSCLFTSVDLAANPDASGPWQEFVIFTQGGTEKGGLINHFGACLAVKDSVDCGQAQFDADQCPDDICGDCTDTASFQSCTGDSGVKATCSAAFGSNLTTKCGSGYSNAFNACSGANAKTGLDQILNIADILCGAGGTAVGDAGGGG